MNEISKDAAVSVCPQCGAVVGDLIKHDGWHSVTSSTAAEIQAGLHGAGV